MQIVADLGTYEQIGGLAFAPANYLHGAVDAAITAAYATLAEREASVAKSEASAAKLRNELADVANGLATLDERSRAGALWDQRRKDIGPEPQLPALPIAPDAPAERVTVPEPHPMLAAARETIARAERAKGAADLADQNRAENVRVVALAEEDAARKDAEATRAAFVVACHRRAPSSLFAGVLEKLRSTGELSLVPREWEERGKPLSGLDVLIAGRPISASSDGQVIVADLLFRAALRAAIKMTWLPIAVDRVGLYVPRAGEPTWSDIVRPIKGPLWLIVTGGTGGIVVTDGV